MLAAGAHHIPPLCALSRCWQWHEKYLSKRQQVTLDGQASEHGGDVIPFIDPRGQEKSSGPRDGNSKSGPPDDFNPVKSCWMSWATQPALPKLLALPPWDIATSTLRELPLDGRARGGLAVVQTEGVTMGRLWE